MIRKKKIDRDIYDIMEYARQQKGYFEIRIPYEPAIRMIATQEYFGYKKEEYVHIEIESGDVGSCIAIAEDIFSDFEYVAYIDGISGLVNFIINIVSLSNELISDDKMESFNELLKIEL